MFIKKIILFIFILPNICIANDCLEYKNIPNITIKKSIWNKQIIQPNQRMNILHGNVTATLIDKYEITADINTIKEGGFCVSIKNVDATIGYSEFLIQIDMSHKKNTCSYNAILSHEDKHIDAYLSVIDKNKDLFNKSLFSAVNSIMPQFVDKEENIDFVIDSFNEQIQTHPDIILLKQHIKADEEIKNKKVDKEDTGESLKKCD